MPFLSIMDGRPVSRGTKGHKLTPKMIEVINLYFSTAQFNMTKAVQLSSYKTEHPARHAAELLQHPLIREEIQRRMDVRVEKSEVKAEYLIQKLMSIIEDTQADNPSACLRAIELAGKSIALWKERQEISGPDGEAIRHEQNIKESVTDFTNTIVGLAKRNSGSSNVVQLTARE